MKIILIHEYKSNAKGYFYPWLKDQLHAAGHEVVIPEYRFEEAPDRDDWTKFLLEAVGTIDQETIIVGHSIGAVMALRFLEAAEAASAPKGVVLVSPPWRIASEEYSGYFLSELDFDVLAWKAKFFTVVHAKDDDVIPFDHGEKYTNVLKAELHAAEEGGHFQDEQAEAVLKAVQHLVKKEFVYEPGKSLEDDFVNIDR